MEHHGTEEELCFSCKPCLITMAAILDCTISAVCAYCLQHSLTQYVHLPAFLISFWYQVSKVMVDHGGVPPSHPLLRNELRIKTTLHVYWGIPKKIPLKKGPQPLAPPSPTATPPRSTGVHWGPVPSFRASKICSFSSASIFSLRPLLSPEPCHGAGGWWLFVGTGWYFTDITEITGGDEFGIIG